MVCPVLLRIEQDCPARSGIFRMFKQKKFHCIRVLRKDAELTPPCCTVAPRENCFLYSVNFDSCIANNLSRAPLSVTPACRSPSKKDSGQAGMTITGRYFCIFHSWFRGGCFFFISFLFHLYRFYVQMFLQYSVWNGQTRTCHAGHVQDRHAHPLLLVTIG